MEPSVHEGGPKAILLLLELDGVHVQLGELVLEGLELLLKLLAVVHEVLPNVLVLLELLKVLGVGGEVGLGGLEEVVEAPQLVDAALLEVGHEHVLPEDYDLEEGGLEGGVVEVDAADGMGALDLLDLLALGVGVLDLLLQLRNVHPVVVDHVLYEFVLALVLPEEG